MLGEMTIELQILYTYPPHPSKSDVERFRLFFEVWIEWSWTWLEFVMKVICILYQNCKLDTVIVFVKAE